MKYRIFLLALLLGASSVLPASRWEIQVGCGAWTLSPFTPILEHEAEKLVEREVIKLVTPFLADFFNLKQESNIHFSSSGQFFSLAIWRRLGPSRFWIGAKAEMVRFRMPVAVDLKQYLSLLGIEIASAQTLGDGRLDIDTVVASLFFRWQAVATRKISLSLSTGMWLLPFSGRMKLDLQTEITSVLGDRTYILKADETLKELRKEIPQTPSLIVSPAIEVLFQYQPFRRGGFYASAAVAQGTVLSLGLFFML